MLTRVHCQVYWRVLVHLAPRTAEPLDLSTVLAAVEGRVVCPTDNQLCTFDLILIDNEVLTTICCSYIVSCFHMLGLIYCCFVR